MAVTRDDVTHIAALACLAINDERTPELVEQLNQILGHMEVLSKVDTAHVAAAVGVGDAGAPLRPDHGPPISLERPRSAFAPEMRDGFFLVPRLATHDALDAATEELE